MHGFGGCRLRGAANGRHDRKKVDIDVDGNESLGWTKYFRVEFSTLLIML